MTTIVPHIGIRISGIQSLEVAKVTIKNGGSIAFIFDQENPKYIDPADCLKYQNPEIKNICVKYKDPISGKVYSNE